MRMWRDFFRHNYISEEKVASGEVQELQNLVLAAAHKYFMSMPHSYFLRKGPKNITFRKRTMQEIIASDLKRVSQNG